MYVYVYMYVYICICMYICIIYFTRKKKKPSTTSMAQLCFSQSVGTGALWDSRVLGEFDPLASTVEQSGFDTKSTGHPALHFLYQVHVPSLATKFQASLKMGIHLSMIEPNKDNQNFLFINTICGYSVPE